MNTSVIRIFLLLTLFSWSFSTFSSAPKRIDAYTPKHGELALAYEMYELDNGLKVLLHKDTTDPVVHVHVGYNVGSKNDSPVKTGFAHLFEHLMFEHIETGGYHEIIEQADGYHEIIEQAGGYANAYTGPDETVYHQTVPANALERVLWLEADRMASIATSITHEKFTAQKGVVTNEKLQTRTNRPYGLVHEKMSMAYYPPDHPYYKTAIGWSEDLEKVTLKDLEAFARSYYVPNNAVITIGGDFNTQDALKWVQKYFGPIAKGPEVTPLKPHIVTLKENKWATYEAPNITVPQLYVLYPTIAPDHPDRLPLALLAQLLGGMNYAKLKQEFKHDPRLLGIQSYHAVQQLDAHFGLFAAINPEHSTDLKGILAEIDAKLVEFSQKPLPQKEIDDLVTVFKNMIFSGLETVGARTGLLRDAWMNEGDPNQIFKDIRNIETLTPKDLQRVCQKYLLGKNRLVLSVVPEGQKNWAAHPANVALERVIADEPKLAPLPKEAPKNNIASLAHMPKLGPLPQRKFPEIWEGFLGDNITVRGFYDQHLPLVKLRFILPYGAYGETQNNAGLAVLLAKMLAKGPEGIDEAAFEKDLDRLGMGFSIDTSSCDWEIEVSLLKQHLDEGLALFARMLRSPALRPQDFQKLQQDMLASFEQNTQDPQFLLSQAQRSLSYLPQDRRILPVVGHAQSVKNITLQNVRDYFADYFHLSYADVYVAGDLNQRDALSALSFLQQWPPARKDPDYSDVHRRYPASGVYIVDAPDAQQNIVQGLQTLMINTETTEKFAMELANQPLGGEFTSRLNHQIREVKGYTYGIHSSIIQSGPLAALHISGQVKPEHTLDTLNEIDTLIDSYVKQGPTEQEITLVKQRHVNREALRYQSLWSKIDLAQYLHENKYTPDNLDAFARQVADFTPEKALALSQKWLKTQDRVYIVVGNQQKLLKELASYQLPLYPLQISKSH